MLAKMCCRILWWTWWPRATVMLGGHLSLGSIQGTLLPGGCPSLAKHQGTQRPVAPLRLEECTKLARVWETLQLAAASHRGRPQKALWPTAALEGWPGPTMKQHAVLSAATPLLWASSHVTSSQHASQPGRLPRLG